MNRSMLNVRCFFIGMMLVVLAIGCTNKQTSSEPAGWRGPTRDGVYPETGLLKSWAESGPQLLWEALDGGEGYSSPVIVGNRIYLTGMNEDKTMEIFMAYSSDGKKVYEVTYGNISTSPYPETRTTPAVVNGKAYMISGLGEIVCINITDGKIVWKVDGGKLYERKTGNWGTAESPLVFDNKVIYTPSGDQTTMVALDTQTGELVWKTKALGDIGTYVSPILITWNGKQQIIGSTAVNLIGVNPDNGNIEWTFGGWEEPPRNPGGGPGGPPPGMPPFEGGQGGPPPGMMPFEGGQGGPPPGMMPFEGGQGGPPPGMPPMVQSNIAPNSPLFKDGRIFFSHGYGIGGYMLQLNDDLTHVSQIWKTEDMDTHIGGYVLVDGTIYGSNMNGNWLAVDWQTGETKYNEVWSGSNSKGSIITADGMLYCYDERRGSVGLVHPDPAKFDVVSQFRITKGEGSHWAHPVINNGILYIRHGSALMAYQIK